MRDTVDWDIQNLNAKSFSNKLHLSQHRVKKNSFFGERARFLALEKALGLTDEPG